MLSKIPLKGGSLSGTYLIIDNESKYVRKEASLSKNREYGFQRWYSQLKRLQRYSIMFPGVFPKVLKYGQDEDFAYFDIEYMENYVTAYDFLISTNDNEKVSKFLDSLIKTMDKMHGTQIKSNTETIYLYVREEVEQKLLDCNSNENFNNFLKYDEIIFNNEKVPSFAKQLDRYKKMFDVYANPFETFTHGNLTLENILYSPEEDKVVFIDPYEENIIDSALGDYSQVLQSCNAKYEIYNSRKETVINNKITINTTSYSGLDYFNEIFNKFLKQRCNEDQYTIVKLLEISQFLRMLPFKMVINENKMFLFYGLASKLFNDLQLNKKKTWNIDTSLEVKYTVKNSPNLFDPSNKDILNYCPNKRAFIAIDQKVSDIYLEKILNYFDKNDIKYQVATIDGIENNKDLGSLLYLLKEIEKFNISRKSEPVIGIGGGVVLDVVGLAATLYRRGIPYIRIPTTLLSIVDVSVAAKTGINFEGRRNRLGSYYPPITSLLDKDFIKTVDPVEISSGLGEVLKMAVIKDYHLFKILESEGKDLLDKKFDCNYADEVIDLSIQGMKEELENNLWEKNLKRIVDFGHSFSPIIEMKSLGTNNQLTHGQAVTLDVIFSCIIAHHRNMITYDDVLRVINTAKNMGLPTYHESFTNPPLLLEALQDTMKHRNGDQNLPMPKSIGKSVFLNNVTYDEIRAAASLFNKINKDEK